MSNERLITLLAVLLLFFGCAEPVSHTVTISGQIAGLSKNKITLNKIIDLPLQEYQKVATFTADNNGHFSKALDLEPHLYQIIIDDNKYPLALDIGQELNITSTPAGELSFEGSPGTDLIQQYETLRLASLDSLVLAVRRAVREERNGANDPDRITELRELEVANYQVHLEELMEFVMTNMTSSIALHWSSLRWNGKEHLNTLTKAIEDLENQYLGAEIIAQLKTQLLVLERTSVGGIVGTIALPDSNKKTIRLSDVSNKLTLIDFWASWCGPCRTESVLLQALYGEYQDKGFEIFGISMDTRKQRWLDAIAKDKRVWPNVSSLKGLRSEEAKQMGVSALPTNFLIDGQGKIVARDIHGEKLVAKVKALLEN